MTTNSNLVPEPRTNKNGVTSIKWVLPNTGNAGSAAAVIPLVRMSTADTAKKSLILSIGDRLSATLTHHKEESKAVFHRNIESYSDETLELLSEACGKTAKQDAFLWNMAMTGTQNDEALDCLDLLPAIEKHDAVDIQDALSFAKETGGYEFLPDRSESPDERRDQSEALFTAAVAIFTDVKINPANVRRYKTGHSDELHSVEDGLARLVAERPEQVHTIVDIMRERNTSDTETIRTVLDHEVRPLSGGFL